MKDSEVATLVNRLRDIATEYRDTQQLRERIAAEIRPLASIAGDSRRIDWLQAVGHVDIRRFKRLDEDEMFEVVLLDDEGFEGETLRYAIDAAIEATDFE